MNAEGLNGIATDVDPIEPLLPTDGWLGDYMRFTQNLQACARFRFMAAACVLGSIVENRVYIQRGAPDLLPKLFPNLWVILLGPPGRGSKTSTINMAVAALQEASDFVRVLADKITPEGLVKSLAEPRVDDAGNIKIRDATGLIKAPEASVLFGKQQYNSAMIPLIADLYDHRKRWSSETIGRGKDVLYNNCISILAGSTPTWLQSQLPPDAFTGGFMSRFVVVEMPPSYDRRVGWPEAPDETSWEALVHDLSLRENMRGEFQWTDEAKELYISDYETAIALSSEQHDAYLTRQSEHIIKLSMVLSLSEGKMVLERRHYRAAREILRKIYPEVERRIDQLTTNPRMQITQEILALLKTNGPMREKAMMRKLYRSIMSERQLDDALKILRRADEIVISKSKPLTNMEYALAPKRRKSSN